MPCQDFHQTTMYNSRFHCSVTGFDLCEACAHDAWLKRVVGLLSRLHGIRSVCALVGLHGSILQGLKFYAATPEKPSAEDTSLGKVTDASVQAPWGGCFWGRLSNPGDPIFQPPLAVEASPFSKSRFKGAEGEV